MISHQNREGEFHSWVGAQNLLRSRERCTTRYHHELPGGFVGEKQYREILQPSPAELWKMNNS